MSSYRFGGRVLLGISLVASSWVLACERQETKPAATAEEPLADSVAFEMATGATLEEIFYGSGTMLDVQPCRGGSGCIACDKEGLDGLKVQDKTKVHCKGAAGKFCADGGTQVRWVFQGGGLKPKVEYRAEVQYTGTGTKLSGSRAYAKAYCRAANGNQGVCEDSGTPKNLVVHSGLPELDGPAGGLLTTYWPYRIDLYEIGADEDETLVACADPEIIVDPPRGGTVIPPGGSGS